MGNKVPHLAAELISHILESCTSKSTVAAAARCSQQYYNIATPLLYDHVHVDNTEVCESGKSRLKCLAILLLSKPHVAAYVRHVSVRPGLEYIFAVGSAEELDGDGEYHSANPGQIQEVDRLLDCCDEERIMRVMKVNRDEILLALLLPTLPNLVSLDLRGPGYADHMDRMLTRFGTGTQHGSAFTKLKSLFWTYQTQRCLPVGAIVSPAIFAMPVIENIYLHQAMGGYLDEEDERLAQFSPRSSTCTHLELRDCRFHSKDLLNLLCIPKSLRTFIYEIGREQFYYCTISFSMIRQGLELHKTTLEEICLDYCHDGVELEPSVTDDPANFTLLDDFPLLKRLKIPSSFIIGRDLHLPSGNTTLWHRRILKLLPRSIERVELTHCEELSTSQIVMLLDALARVLIQKALTVPTLDKIILEVTTSIVNERLADFEQLLRLAVDAGTNIVLLNNFKDNAGTGHSQKVERKWGFDENIEWKDCYDFENYKPVYEDIVM